MATDIAYTCPGLSCGITRLYQTGRFRRILLPPFPFEGSLMSTKVLTPLGVKAAKPKRNGAGELIRAEYPDRGCAALYLIVQPSGLKSWAFRYPRGARPH